MLNPGRDAVTLERTGRAELPGLTGATVRAGAGVEVGEQRIDVAGFGWAVIELAS